jgi:aconitate hydratase
MSDPFNARATLSTPLGERAIHRLDALKSIGDVDSLPYSIKVLLEAALRNHDGHAVTDEDIKAIASYDATKVGETEFRQSWI